jgi:hypothetical protein
MWAGEVIARWLDAVSHGEHWPICSTLSPADEPDPAGGEPGVVAVPDEEAARLGFAGSSTVLLDGVDPFATGDEPTGLVCRVYPTPHGPQGSPTLEQLRKVLR